MDIDARRERGSVSDCGMAGPGRLPGQRRHFSYEMNPDSQRGLRSQPR
jgi:hypothetical protein